MDDKVRRLSVDQKNQLVDQIYYMKMKLNPILDADNEWFISNEEVNACNIEKFAWIKTLPEIDHNPVIIEI